jgi:hypothetical protein
VTKVTGLSTRITNVTSSSRSACMGAVAQRR